MDYDYDVAIIGGGLVGASLAIALSHTSLRVAIIEAGALYTRRKNQRPHFDDRSIALAYGSQRIFTALGVWPEVSKDAEPIFAIHISDRGHFGATRLHAKDEGVDALGYVVESRILGHVLSQQVLRCENVTILSPATVSHVAFSPAAVQLRLRSLADPGGVSKSKVAQTTVDQEQEIRVRLVVGADGTQSTLREQLDIPTRQWNYGQTAIVTNVLTANTHNNVAYERFTQTGPLAMLPLPFVSMPDEHANEVSDSLSSANGEVHNASVAGRCAVVWTVNNEQVSALLGLPKSEFIHRLQAQFGYRLGRIEYCGERQAFPLQLVTAKATKQARLALVGNAAHTLHPVAGQGFNLGMRDVAVLAELLADMHDQGKDIGGLPLIQQYEKLRKGDHTRAIAFTDILVRLFSNPLRPVAWLRDVGLIAVDVLPLVKHGLSRQTMGLAGVLPKLSRGLPLRSVKEPPSC